MTRSSQRDQIDLPDPPRVQHPGHPYQCGRGHGGVTGASQSSSDASPCAEGPSVSGECPLARHCAGRGSKSGAPKKKGALDNTPCRPIPTWAGRRRRWTAGALLLFAFALVGVFGTSLAPEFVRPGNLSTSHAQILTGDLTSGGCTVCHGNVSAETWMAMKDAGHVETEASLTMTDRCVACHHDRIPTDFATSAHNLSVETRVAIGDQRRDIFLAAKEKGEIRTVSKSSAAIWLPPPAISQDEVACSVCHREHHGADADIKAIADSRCQTCHSQQFGSFASSHPEFTDWPQSSPHAIAFDHSRHATIHYPKTAEAAASDESVSVLQFDCRACHVVDGAGSSNLAGGLLNDSIVSTLPFESACVSCHDQSLGVQIASGPALIELPILPPEIADQLESWPADATGSPDGKLSAWMLLLLRDQDPSIDFAPLADLSLVDWRLPHNQDLAVRLGRAIRQFAIALSLDGQSFLLEAAERAGADPTTARAFASSFPTQVMRDAAADWFGKPTSSAGDRFSARQTPASNNDQFLDDDLTSAGDDLLVDWSAQEDDDLLLSGDASASLDDPLGGDLLSGGASSDTTQEAFANWEDELGRRFDAARSQSLGGWYRDDLTLSIRYRGAGHSDAVLRSLIEMAETSDHTLRDLVMEQPAVAACVTCHSQLPWRETTSNSLRDRLTRFTHRPHLDIAALQNCEHCHTMHSNVGADPSLPAVEAVAERGGVETLYRALDLVNAVSAKPDLGLAASDHSLTEGFHHDSIEPETAEPQLNGHSDFLPLRKVACAHCHTAKAAGDHCTTCHRYHVGDVLSNPTTADSVEPVR